jgi:ubiquitin C-terminal hydrolase
MARRKKYQSPCRIDAIFLWKNISLKTIAQVRFCPLFGNFDQFLDSGNYQLCGYIDHYGNLDMGHYVM